MTDAGAGAATSTGNAAPWFPGDEPKGVAVGIYGVAGAWSFEVLAVQKGKPGYAILGALLTVAVLSMITTMFAFSIRTFRIDIFGPKDIPLVFNRKTRKVYQVLQRSAATVNPYARLPWFGKRLLQFWGETIFEHWPMQLIEYDWACLEAEYFERMQMMGKVLTKNTYLQFYVKESATSNTVISSFTIASPIAIGRQSAMNLWEYLRRYMEEDGPVMNAGDQPAAPYPTSLLGSAQAVLPYAWVLAVAALAWGVHDYWINGLYSSGQGFLHVVLVFSATLMGGLFTLTIIFNRLAHILGEDVTLPAEYWPTPERRSIWTTWPARRSRSTWQVGVRARGGAKTGNDTSRS